MAPFLRDFRQLQPTRGRICSCRERKCWLGRLTSLKATVTCWSRQISFSQWEGQEKMKFQTLSFPLKRFNRENQQENSDKMKGLNLQMCCLWALVLYLNQHPCLRQPSLAVKCLLICRVRHPLKELIQIWSPHSMPRKAWVVCSKLVLYLLQWDHKTFCQKLQQKTFTNKVVLSATINTAWSSCFTLSHSCKAWWTGARDAF